jgi:hypothetical protein
MIALLTGLLAKRGIGAAAKPLAWTIIAMVAVALFWTAKATYDRNLVSTNNAQAEADGQARSRIADAKAADRRADDQARLTQESDELRKVITDGTPQAPLDDARRAYYRCVRLQQAARADNLRPPPCR